MSLLRVGGQPLRLFALLLYVPLGDLADVRGLLLGDGQDVLDPGPQVSEGNLIDVRVAAAPLLRGLQLRLLHLRRHRLDLVEGVLPLGGERLVLGLQPADELVYLPPPIAPEGDLEGGLRRYAVAECEEVPAV